MRYVRRRLIFYLIAFWTSITLNFLIPRLMPGNPAENLMMRMHGKISPYALKALEAEFGVFQHANLAVQYWRYLIALAHGNLGVSITYFPIRVSTVIGQSLIWTLGLIGTATIISFVLGTWLGIWVAWHRHTAWDRLTVPVAMFTSAFPYFWLALIVLYVLGFVLGWFPLSGAYSNTLPPALTLPSIADLLYHAALPALTIVVVSLGGWILSMRNNMIPSLNEDYIQLARAAGLKERTIMYQYAARNALLPNLTGFAMALGFIVAGGILTEIVFSYPGLGFLLYQASSNQDYPLLQGLLLMISFAVLLANFAVDLLYGRLDPRAARSEV